MSDILHIKPQDLLTRLPLPATDRWPDGVFDIEAFERGGLMLELFAPRDTDRQTSHGQDELYIVISGNAVLEVEGDDRPCATGDVLFVAARAPHRFVRISDDFATWALFWGERR
jgi:mannose-6-phosphate isomerase-like protein (cupin superfamily)